MKPITNSRGDQINLEKCVINAGNRYDLIIAASQRLRELKRRAQETGAYVTAVDALLELQQGRVDVPQYLAKVKTPQRKRP
jgi:DNA-directed RNA polymerase subunit K/omega